METCPAEILLIRPPAPVPSAQAGPRALAAPEARPGPVGSPPSPKADNERARGGQGIVT